jgi:hypothetical protein
MFDDESCKRCVRIARSFFRSTLASILEKLEDKSLGPKMEISWAEAEETLAALDADGASTWSTDKRVLERKRAGYRIETRFGFMTMKEFWTRTHFEAKILGAKTVELTNEEGTRKIQGVLFRLAGEADHFYRVVVFFSETAWFVDEYHLTPKEPQHTTCKANPSRAIFKNLFVVTPQQASFDWPVSFIYSGRPF